MTPTPPPTLLPTEATTTIEKLVAGGEGLGRLADGRVVFVAGALPQEQVSGVPVKHLGRWVLQSPNIQTPSPHRLTPPCPHATTCGGCDWQHLAIDQQRHWKTRLVHESLIRLGKVTDPPVADMLEETDWAYRTTVSWEVVPGTTSSPARLAYHTRHNSGQTPGLIPFDTCPTLAEPLQRTATLLQQNAPLLTGLQRVKARCNQQGEVLLGLDFGPQQPDAPLEHQPYDALLVPPVVGIFQLQPLGKSQDPAQESALPRAGQATLQDTFAGHRFTLGLGHFMQSHPLATHRLIGWIQQQLASLPPVTTLLDLYCGVGILSLPLLAPQQSLTGIEGSAQAIALATQNAINLGKQAQATFTATSVEAFTQTTDATFDVAICDPPRNGIKPAVLQWLSDHVSQALFYVSCDPATLARDTQLLGQQGWQLTAVQPVDMFPQTSHVETVCLFRRTMG